MTKDELSCLKACLINVEQNGISDISAISRDVYSTYYSQDFRCFMTRENVGIKESHDDVYMCEIPDSEEGDVSKDFNTLHSLDVSKILEAIPVKSGVIPNFTSKRVLVFRTSAEHVHIVDDLEEKRVLGKVVFCEEFLQIEHYEIVPLEEARKLVFNSWNSKTSFPHYYGIVDDQLLEGTSLENLPQMLERRVLRYQSKLIEWGLRKPASMGFF